MGRSSSRPSRDTLAVFGWRLARARMASEARPLARVSIRRPNRIKVMMAAEVSKYTAGVTPPACNHSGETVATTLYP